MTTATNDTNETTPPLRVGGHVTLPPHQPTANQLPACDICQKKTYMYVTNYYISSTFFDSCLLEGHVTKEGVGAWFCCGNLFYETEAQTPGR